MRVGDQFAGLDRAGFLDGQVLVFEQMPNIGILDFLLRGVGMLLHHLLELHLQVLRQVEIVVRLEQVGHAALAGLRVHANDRLVRTADVLRIDRQVRHEPHEVLHVHAGHVGGDFARFEALLDRVLAASRRTR